MSPIPPTRQQAAPPHNLVEQRINPLPRLSQGSIATTSQAGPRLSVAGVYLLSCWPANKPQSYFSPVTTLAATATTIPPVLHQTVMAPYHFRFLDKSKTRLNFPPLSPLPWHNLNDFEVITRFNHHDPCSPHLWSPWPNDSAINHLLPETPVQLSNTLLPLANSSAYRLDQWFVDSDFNLPKGFLSAHPTVTDVLNTDTKLLPSVPVSPGPYSSQFKSYFKHPAPTESLKSKSSSDFRLYSQVIAFKCPNYIWAKVDVNPDFPVKTWDSVFANYHDKQLVSFMRYGWPTSFMGDTLPTLSLPNHASSVRPQAVQSFLDKEVSLHGLAGPFTECPFEWLRLNPMMTREKKNSDEYRFILDLSIPKGLILIPSNITADLLSRAEASEQDQTACRQFLANTSMCPEGTLSECLYSQTSIRRSPL